MTSTRTSESNASSLHAGTACYWTEESATSPPRLAPPVESWHRRLWSWVKTVAAVAAVVAAVVVVIGTQVQTFNAWREQPTPPMSEAPPVTVYQPAPADGSPGAFERYRVETETRAFFAVWRTPGPAEARAAALRPWMAADWWDRASRLQADQLPTGQLCCPPRDFTIGPDGAVLYRVLLSDGHPVQIQGILRQGRFYATDVQG